MGMSLAASAGQFFSPRVTQSAALARSNLHKPASPARHCGASLTRVLVADGRQPGQAGRMVISGRIDAVCAELERLSRLEAH